jgi:hypothetical protein
MSVDLGGLKTGVSQKFLDDPQVCTPVEQVGGKTVAQGVRMGGHRGASIDDASHVARA